jgi:hypothetical protein
LKPSKARWLCALLNAVVLLPVLRLKWLTAWLAAVLLRLRGTNKKTTLLAAS